MKRSLQWALLAGLFVSGFAPAGVHAQSVTPPVGIPKELTSYRDIVKQVLPAVVSIDAKKLKKSDSRTAQLPAELPDGVPEQFRRYFEQQQQQNQNPNLGFASGFVVDPSGVIMTNHHVVEGADTVEITFTDGRKYTSTDFKSDKNSDLAIIRIKTDTPLSYLQFGDSSQMEVGDRVLAVGAPFGLAGSVTHGIISAKGRDIGINRRQADDLLQTDAAINPGNSGGPLVNLAGQVIGINSAIKSRSGGFQGIGLAIAGNQARSVMQQLLTNGVVKRGYLGIEMSRKVSPEVAARLGLKNGGIVVGKVIENTPAAKAGLRPDDAIVGLAGKSVRENRELQSAVAALPLGQPVQLDIIRDGQPIQLSLKIEEAPAKYGDNAPPAELPRGGVANAEVVSVPKAGLELADLTAERAEALGVDLKSGAIIVRVESEGPAADAGLSRGLIIVNVDKKAVATAEQAKAALEASDRDKGALVQAFSPRDGREYVIVKVQK